MMAIAVELPALGESVVEGTISRWLVKEGDRVEVDQPLVEVTTDKVDAEIPAPVAGVVGELLVAEGETVAVGADLLHVIPEGEAVAARVPPASPRSESAPAAASARSGGPTATPLARRVAEASGVDLAHVAASGQRIRREDVERHAAALAPVAPAPPRGPAPAPPAAERAAPAFMSYALQPGDKVVPMTPLRRLVAEHMVFSKRVSPHVGTVAEVDLAGVVRVRDSQKRAFQDAHGFALSFLPFIVHATVRALREVPRLNASLVEDAIVEKKDIHIGIAVETDKGLVVPVVRHADRLSLAGLAQAVEDLASRARTKKLSPDELKGGTFTVSNPGRHGNLYGFAIINQPQVGILRMGEIVKRPVVRTVGGEDAILIRPIMHLALSYDHRVVDGAPANGFLHRVRELLEEAEFDL
jgi:2-oxoglutarate dehydrogenase E2 component (dihydrolipoamide succinyltransferase)